VNEYEIFIYPDGTIRFIYDDKLRPLLEEGKSDIRRASHVEPEYEAGEWLWYADLSPVSGPKIGPYQTRDGAIAAEIDWLITYHLPYDRNMSAD
jgi:hypothetical protein